MCILYDKDNRIAITFMAEPSILKLVLESKSHVWGGSLKVGATATIRLKFLRKKQLPAVFEALEPEARTITTRRSKVTVKKEDNTLTLIFEAGDIPALRAALNSYLHWIRLTKDVLDKIETWC